MYPDSPTRASAVRPSPVFLGIVAIAVFGGVLAWRATGVATSGRIGVFLLVVAGWVVTLCLHEFAHAWVAWRNGDHDVVIRGYLTLDPRKYTQPLLSIGLPVLFLALGGIGLPGGAVYLRTWAMPPRVQTRVALAGPAVNAVSAVILLVVIRLFGPDGAAGPSVAAGDHQVFWYGLSFLAFLQVMATILNLLPVPGLDGYGALEPHLKASTRASLDKIKPYGLLLLIALLFVPQINAAFFDAIYWIFGLSGVPDVYAAFGNYLMQFWR
ncbi:site-2 protease family protein [Prescottella agglutinans]|uniref:Site-2 protease family protein n=1 Tax=Prescottella agglutinans TaxID=1644129 RepID=A0A3S3APX1_9NOCA|nr:site-2 protease family protein [Prescottella agglutinans]RVW09993.1 site-2 protease family protein [Prescottella agglutinans]